MSSIVTSTFRSKVISVCEPPIALTVSSFLELSFAFFIPLQSAPLKCR